MRVLIVGGSGLVGGNCLSYLRILNNYEVLGTHLSFATEHTVYFNPANLNDDKNQEVITFAPEVIIHCGALTFVDYCENNPDESYDKTVNSTANVIKLAKQHNAKLIYISTDYVFDGKKGPYTEEDSVNPESIYGLHKLEAENQVIKSGLNYLILRITNVYGDEIRNKNFISRIINQIDNNEEINLVLPYDQYATPINARDIARAINQLLTFDKVGIYHLGSTDYMNRCQLATRVLKKFNYAGGKIKATTTAEMQQAVKRPLLGGLLATKFLGEFPDFEFTNIDDYLNTKFNA